MRPIRLAVLNLTAGGLSGGYKLYLQKFLPLVAKNPGVEKILFASPPGMNAGEWLAPPPKVEFVDCLPYQFLIHRTDLALNKNLTAFSPDVIFVPVLRYFSFGETPVVTMIQNMAPFSSWGYYNLWEKVRLAVQYADSFSALAKSVKIIAISGFIKKTLLDKFNIPASKVCQISFGVEPLPTGARPRNVPDTFANFLFTAGSIDPYRGIEDIILAFSELNRRSALTDYLVVAGATRPEMAWYLRKLQRLAKENGIADRIFWAGQVPQSEISWLYSNCKAFLMTSRVESFPMIALEAAASGCQCVSTDNPAALEIFSDTASYYSPGDYLALAGIIGSLAAANSPMREAARKRIVARAGTFSWERCCESTIDCLAEVVSVSRSKMRKSACNNNG